jgi:uncharacterized FAD-dependent dehydrogenase
VPVDAVVMAAGHSARELYENIAIKAEAKARRAAPPLISRPHL